MIEVELPVVGIDAVVIDRFLGGAPGKQRSCRAADEMCDLGEDIDPQRRVQGGVIDLRDQGRRLPLVAHHAKASIGNSA